MKIMHAVGARPNFMKAAPLIRELGKHAGGFQQTVVHTGQHYDEKMSGAFFVDLDLPEPDIHLGVGSGSHAEQTARVLLSFEPVLLANRPDWLVVFGDVNSTLACALTAAKMGIPIAHVESGLRSFDRSMPEELNRILTDQLSDLLFITEESARRNLVKEGIGERRIHFVGNTMIDTLVRLLPKAESSLQELCGDLQIEKGRYVLVTLHRPFNVDDENRLGGILRQLSLIARRLPVVFPVHPRTRKRIGDPAELASQGVTLLEPLGYLDFLGLEAHAALVLTDSGGIQEETTYLGVPCLTLRPNTERPVTVEVGTNRLASEATPLSEQALSCIESHKHSARIAYPKFWDGMAARRIREVLGRNAD